MAFVAIGLGVLLAGLGLFGFLSTGSEHPTALIPTYFGLVFFILGLLAFKDKLRKHAMHAAAVVGLLGFVGSAVMVVRKLATPTVVPLSGSSVPEQRSIALACQVIMAVLCGIFEALCVRSFIIARRNRAEPGERTASAP